jgi:hypothetical protein
MNLSDDQRKKIIDGVTPKDGLPAMPADESRERWLTKARLWETAKREGRELGRAEMRAEYERRIVRLETQVAALMEDCGKEPTKAAGHATTALVRRPDPKQAETDRMER